MYFRVSQGTSQNYAWYVLCAFRAFCNSWKSFLYIHTVLVVIAGPCFSESRLHEVAVEPSNIIERLVGVQICMLFLLEICLDGTVNTTFSQQHCPYGVTIL